MIVVFWLELNHMEELQMWEAHHQTFAANKLSEALKFAEDLRKKRKEGADIVKQGFSATQYSHICLQSEMPESVGQPGVSEVGKDYNWSKRRIDPSIPLGRPSGDDIPVDFSEE